MYNGHYISHPYYCSFPVVPWFVCGQQCELEASWTVFINRKTLMCKKLKHNNYCKPAGVTSTRTAQDRFMTHRICCRCNRLSNFCEKWDGSPSLNVHQLSRNFLPILQWRATDSFKKCIWVQSISTTHVLREGDKEWSGGGGRNIGEEEAGLTILSNSW